MSRKIQMTFCWGLLNVDRASLDARRDLTPTRCSEALLTDATREEHCNFSNRVRAWSGTSPEGSCIKLIEAVNEARIADIHLAHRDIRRIEPVDGPALMWDLLSQVDCLDRLIPECCHAAGSFCTCRRSFLVHQCR